MGTSMANLATILLAEDNEDDVVLMKLAFKKAGLSNPLHVVSDGAEAMEYLKGAVQARSSGYAIPLLISLDLNMPGVSGLEVLAWIREQPELKKVPVLILSQSERQRDINRATCLGVNAYLVKPANFEGLVRIIGIFKKVIGQVQESERAPARNGNHVFPKTNLRIAAAAAARPRPRV